jgi:Gluconate 2-dehydrogenase subunit 3
MNLPENARRLFLQQFGSAAGLAWLNAQWPAIVAASEHAHQAVSAKKNEAFEVLTPEEAREVEAVTSVIIPTDDLPGAREAGVVYFIDQALKTFAKEALPVYEKGLASLSKLTAEMYPGVERFSAATPEQQEKIFAEFEAESDPQKKPSRRNQISISPDFMQTVWFHTVVGFLADPEAGGNRDYAGWKVIGRDPAHMFAPPFGAYDKDYPGWQAAPPETEKK